MSADPIHGLAPLPFGVVEGRGLCFVCCLQRDSSLTPFARDGDYVRTHASIPVYRLGLDK